MAREGVSGKWIVLVLLLVGLLMAALRWIYVPKTNPKDADTGNPFYSPSSRKSSK